MRSLARLWLVVSLLWTGVIFYGSTTSGERLADRVLGGLLALFGPAMGPDDGTSPDYFWEKKAIHVILFATLAFFLSRASIASAWLTPGVIVLLGAAVGASSEAFQLFFPAREPSLRDLLLNVGATCAGVLVFHPWGRHNRQASQATSP